MNEIKLADLALVAHVTPSYLSTNLKRNRNFFYRISGETPDTEGEEINKIWK